MLVAKASGDGLHLLILDVGVHPKVANPFAVGLADQVGEEKMTQVLASKARPNRDPVNRGVWILIVLPLAVFDV